MIKTITILTTIFLLTGCPENELAFPSEGMISERDSLFWDTFVDSKKNEVAMIDLKGKKIKFNNFAYIEFIDNEHNKYKAEIISDESDDRLASYGSFHQNGNFIELTPNSEDDNTKALFCNGICRSSFSFSIIGINMVGHGENQRVDGIVILKDHALHIETIKPIY
jgi:hypothetical protein